VKSDSTQLPDASESTTSYEHILRSIGLGLEALGVQAFDLEVDGNKYIVEGESEVKKTEIVAKPSDSKSVFRNFWSDLKTQFSTPLPPKKSPFVFLGMQFTPKDLDRLEQQGETLGSPWEEAPDLHSLPQILWTVGAYVDHKGGRLLRVSKHNQTVTIGYRNFTGSEQTEEFTESNLYDFWVHVYVQRRKPSGAVTTDSDKK
jgi:hypothetical protein